MLSTMPRLEALLRSLDLMQRVREVGLALLTSPALSGQLA
jgi:hypothetical protein